MPISPASTLVIENVAIIAGIAKLKICTSKASSAHPPKQAQNVRLSLGASSAYHFIDPKSELGFVAIALVMVPSDWPSQSSRTGFSTGAQSTDQRIAARGQVRLRIGLAYP